MIVRIGMGDGCNAVQTELNKMDSRGFPVTAFFALRWKIETENGKQRWMVSGCKHYTYVSMYVLYVRKCKCKADEVSYVYA